MLFIDKMILDATPRRSADGYLVAIPKVARVGIQEYGGFEVGRPNVDTVRVYRPEEEVFNKDALHSFGHRPVTVDHPPVLVDAKNWKKYAKGTTGGDVLRDGEFITVPMALMDEDAISTVLSGEKVELSMGYTADLDFTPGTTPTGEQYDAIQRNIRGNHLAIVDTARGGKQLRVIDTQPTQEDLFMSARKIVIDGITVETTDMAAEVFGKHMRDMEEKAKTDEDKIKALEDEIEALKAKKDEDKKASETKDAEIATLKKQVEDSAMTPAKLDDAVKARAVVVDAAKKVLSSVVVDGKTDSEIRRQVVDSKLGDVAKDWSDEQVAASFNTLSASPVDAYRQSQMKTGDNKNVTSYDAHKQRLENAYKMKQEA
jgi:hypothetical protein